MIDSLDREVGRGSAAFKKRREGSSGWRIEEGRALQVWEGSSSAATAYVRYGSMQATPLSDRHGASDSSGGGFEGPAVPRYTNMRAARYVACIQMGHSQRCCRRNRRFSGPDLFPADSQEKFPKMSV